MPRDDDASAIRQHFTNPAQGAHAPVKPSIVGATDAHQPCTDPAPTTLGQITRSQALSQVIGALSELQEVVCTIEEMAHLLHCCVATHPILVDTILPYGWIEQEAFPVLCRVWAGGAPSPKYITFAHALSKIMPRERRRSGTGYRVTPRKEATVPLKTQLQTMPLQATTNAVRPMRQQA